MIIIIIIIIIIFIIINIVIIVIIIIYATLFTPSIEGDNNQTVPSFKARFSVTEISIVTTALLTNSVVIIPLIAIYHQSNS